MTRRPSRASFWLALLERASHPQDRPWIVSDAVDEFDRRLEHDEKDAMRWLRSQALRAIGPGIAERWRRRGRGAAQPDSRGWLAALADDFRRDLALAARSLARTPALVLLIAMSLGVGIAGTAVVFSIGQSVLFPGPGPITDPSGIVTIYESSDRGDPWRQVSFPNYQDVLASTPALSDAAASRIGIVRLGEDSSGERLMVELVTGNYFDLMGIQPVIGRTFSPEESRIGAAAPLIVLGHDLWLSRYGGTPDVLGQTVRVDGRPHTIIGVAPPRLTSRLMQLRVDAWLPLGIPGGTYHATEEELGNRADQEYQVLGRLSAGADLAQVEMQLGSLALDLAERFPEVWHDQQGQARAFSVLSEKESRIPPDFRMVGAIFLVGLLGAAGLLLTIACSNVAGLLLVRAQRRLAEMAVRLSLGASRGRIVRMLLSESLLLALLGATVGVLLTAFFIGRASGIPLPGSLPDLSFDLRVDVPVLLFAVAVATLASVIFGLAPALQAARSGSPMAGVSMRQGRGGRGRRRLVVAQIAGSAVFLIAAGLLQRTATRAAARDSGLESSNLAVVNWELGPEEATGPAAIVPLMDRFLEDPAIDRVELASSVEGSPFWSFTGATLRLPSREEPVYVPYNAVTPGYAEMVGLDLLQGRWLNGNDRAGAVPSVVVNQRFATLYFPDGDALGRTFTIEERLQVSTPVPGEESTVQIVGIAETVMNTPSEAPEPYFWASLEQFPARTVVIHAAGSAGPGASLAAVTRLTSDRTSVIGPALQREIAEVELTGHRAVGMLMRWGAGFALSLSVIGLTGLLSFSVGLRMPELSMRRALGADTGDLLREVLGEGGRAGAWGVAIGMLVAVPMAVLSRNLLFGVSPLDPITIGGTAVLLLLSALLSGVPAALRVLRSDPLRYLRGD